MLLLKTSDRPSPPMLNRGNFTSIIAQSPLRAKMPKDEDEDEVTSKEGRTKRVTFALNEIHHEISDGEDVQEKRPVRKKVPSYALGRPLADYDATDHDVSVFIKKWLILTI
ncbi:uncharacterized protein LOC110238870 isoform X2 [Exaiptasia diaphana]|uniref:Uncharacterized protein n=1 Tax=Exaiptasia diaphana TaxID=2652724 RepID=A0A913YKF1_EXADI|nr:uncharacterized protein LOC110238870 isoform X2 [Exaiptasia diaphana]